MLETPEVEATVHHKTGHSLADKILAVLAVFLSCVSVFIAVSHGRTMEHLVAANSWPNISFGTSNTNDAHTRDEITLTIRNTGVGPARIDSFEVFYKGKPVTDAVSLIKACCGKGHVNLSYSTVVDEVLPARESIDVITLARDKNPPEIWDALNNERFALHGRICYCSVFDECWVRDTQARRPERVAECKPTQPIVYR